MQNLEANQDHVVQFYETDAYLAGVVGPYLASNLRQGAPAFVVCTLEHLSAITAALSATGIDVALLRSRGSLVWRDARALLPKLSSRGRLSRAAFQREIGEPVGDLCARFDIRPLHVYGELVDLLWAEGRAADAVELEELWNRLACDHTFNLMCAYRVQSSGADEHRLRAVCTAHSHVLRPEKPIGIEVLDDERGRLSRLGESEMIRARSLRDQRIADGLREDLAQSLFGLLLLCQSIRPHVPFEVRDQIANLLESLDRALQMTLMLADEVAPVHLRAESLSETVYKYAAMTERLFDVTCSVAISRTFCDPDRIQRELLYAIMREVVDRAARDRGAREISIELSRRGKRQQLAIYHDGDSVTVIGARDDLLRRLIYQSHALGNQLEVRPSAKGKLQVRCRW